MSVCLSVYVEFVIGHLLKCVEKIQIFFLSDNIGHTT